MVYVIHINREEGWVEVMGSKKEAIKRAREILGTEQACGREGVQYIDNARFKRTDIDEYSATSVVVERKYSYYNGA